MWTGFAGSSNPSRSRETHSICWREISVIPPAPRRPTNDSSASTRKARESSACPTVYPMSSFERWQLFKDPCANRMSSTAGCVTMISSGIRITPMRTRALGNCSCDKATPWERVTLTTEAWSSLAKPDGLRQRQRWSDDLEPSTRLGRPEASRSRFALNEVATCWWPRSVIAPLSSRGDR